MMRWKLLVLLVVASACCADSRISLSGLDVRGYPSLSIAASVTDKSTGATVKGLKRGDFQVCIDEVDQPQASAESVLSGGRKIALAILVDTSGSMRGMPLSSANQAISGMLARLSAKDRAAIIGFSDRVHGGVDYMTDRERLRKRLAGLRAVGETAFYDAVARSSESAAKQHCDRNVVVALTDGRDNVSKLTYVQCMDRIRSAGVPVYIIGLGRDVAEDKLDALASESGGRYFAAASPSDLQSIYQSIAENIQNQYIVKLDAPRSFNPGTWHSLSVSAGDATGKIGFMVPTASSNANQIVSSGTEMWDVFPVGLIILGAITVLAVGTLVVVRNRRYLKRRKA